jgi:hypothetical protein
MLFSASRLLFGFRCEKYMNPETMIDTAIKSRVNLNPESQSLKGEK